MGLLLEAANETLPDLELPISLTFDIRSSGVADNKYDLFLTAINEKGVILGKPIYVECGKLPVFKKVHINNHSLLVEAKTILVSLYRSKGLSSLNDDLACSIKVGSNNSFENFYFEIPRLENDFVAIAEIVNSGTIWNYMPIVGVDNKGVVDYKKRYEITKKNKEWF